MMWKKAVAPSPVQIVQGQGLDLPGQGHNLQGQKYKLLQKATPTKKQFTTLHCGNADAMTNESCSTLNSV